jgi:hypothetical protein
MGGFIGGGSGGGGTGGGGLSDMLGMGMGGFGDVPFDSGGGGWDGGGGGPGWGANPIDQSAWAVQGPDAGQPQGTDQSGQGQPGQQGFSSDLAQLASVLSMNQMGQAQNQTRQGAPGQSSGPSWFQNQPITMPGVQQAFATPPQGVPPVLQPDAGRAQPTEGVEQSQPMQQPANLGQQGVHQTATVPTQSYSDPTPASPPTASPSQAGMQSSIQAFPPTDVTPTAANTPADQQTSTGGGIMDPSGQGPASALGQLIQNALFPERSIPQLAQDAYRRAQGRPTAAASQTQPQPTAASPETQPAAAHPETDTTYPPFQFQPPAPITTEPGAAAPAPEAQPTQTAQPMTTERPGAPGANLPAGAGGYGAPTPKAPEDTTAPPGATTTQAGPDNVTGGGQYGGQPQGSGETMGQPFGGGFGPFGGMNPMQGILGMLLGGLLGGRRGAMMGMIPTLMGLSSQMGGGMRGDQGGINPYDYPAASDTPDYARRPGDRPLPGTARENLGVGRRRETGETDGEGTGADVKPGDIPAGSAKPMEDARKQPFPSGITSNIPGPGGNYTPTRNADGSTTYTSPTGEKLSTAPGTDAAQLPPQSAPVSGKQTGEATGAVGSEDPITHGRIEGPASGLQPSREQQQQTAADAQRAAVGQPNASGVPERILAAAREGAMQGGPGAVFHWMARNGHPKSGNWCGEFAAAVMQRAGLPVPPGNPAVASTWRRWGNPTGTPQPGDIAVRRGPRTGDTGSHVTTVQRVYRDGSMDIIGGNQRGGIAEHVPAGYMRRFDFRTMRNTQVAQRPAA